MKVIESTKTTAVATELGGNTKRYFPIVRYSNSSEWFPTSIISKTRESAIESLHGWKDVSEVRILEFEVPEIFISG